METGDFQPQDRIWNSSCGKYLFLNQRRIKGLSSAITRPTEVRFYGFAAEQLM